MGGDDRGRQGQRLSMIATTGGGGGGWGRAAEAAAGEGMSSAMCVFLCFVPYACAASKATMAQISFAPEGGPDRALWTAQDFALCSL